MTFLIIFFCWIGPLLTSIMPDGKRWMKSVMERACQLIKVLDETVQDAPSARFSWVAGGTNCATRGGFFMHPKWSPDEGPLNFVFVLETRVLSQALSLRTSHGVTALIYCVEDMADQDLWSFKLYHVSIWPVTCFNVFLPYRICHTLLFVWACQYV